MKDRQGTRYNKIMANTIKDSLKSGIELYTERKVKDLKVHADPKVSGAYAMRATMVDGDVIDFLLQADWQLNHRRFDAHTVSTNLEEAMWNRWPPRTGKIEYVATMH